jgi:single-stranded DNA-binding protein
MARINPKNFGVAIGRLASDPRFFNNRDGSRTVRFTVLVDQDFVNVGGERGTDAVSVERFIPNDRGNGVFDMIHQGDLVEVSYRVTTDSYVDRNDERRYVTKLIVSDVQMLESRKVTTERLAKRAAQQDAQNRAAQAAQAAPVAAPVQQVAPAAVSQAPQAPVFADDALNASDPFGDGFDQGNPPF